MSFCSLYLKECNQILKSIIYIIFVGVVAVFYVSQFDGATEKSIAQYKNPDVEISGYKEGLSQLITNRIIYSVIAIILLVITMAVFELKRRGMINLGETWKKYLEIARVQIKLSTKNNLPLAILCIILMPIIFGIQNLDSIASSMVLERFISIIGIILLTPLYLPEQDKNVAEIV